MPSRTGCALPGRIGTLLAREQASLARWPKRNYVAIAVPDQDVAEVDGLRRALEEYDAASRDIPTGR